LTTWLDMEEKWADELQRNTDKVKKSKESKKDAPSPSAAKDKGKSDKAEKGKRVYTPGRKEMMRHWKHLKKSLRDPRTWANIAFAAALVVALVATVCRRRYDTVRETELAGCKLGHRPDGPHGLAGVDGQADVDGQAGLDAQGGLVSRDTNVQAA